MQYKAPLNDMAFLLEHVFNVDQLWQDIPAFEDVNCELGLQIIEEGAKLCEKVASPLNLSGDAEGCSLLDGKVTTPKGFKDAFNQVAQGGWVGFTGNPEYEGMGMPKMLSLLFEEMQYASNTSLTLYSGLTIGCCLAIDKHANEALKQAYLPKLYSGEWTGAMGLTEPHCGTDLGLIRTKAIPKDDEFLLSGTKIFITGGEHDLTENIVHLVLAKLPDAPEGVKGISLFLVPKILDGKANGIHCSAIEHKMGIKASSTCVLNFENSRGFLVGKENQGLAAMFTMMNYERLSIGLQGVGLAQMAYQRSVEYAGERLQGKAVGAKEKLQPIWVHGDVKRMIIHQKAMVEAGRAFALYVGSQLDVAKYHPESDKQQVAQNNVELLTPVAKAFFTDRGFEATVLGQQVFGGHGYIHEMGMEQLVRDARIAQIYEGTNGIQALDLAGRKLVANRGVWLESFIEEMELCLEQFEKEFSQQAKQMRQSIKHLGDGSQWLLANGSEDPFVIGASSVDMLDLLGYNAYGFMWMKMLIGTSNQSNQILKDQKLKTANYFFKQILPITALICTRITAGSDELKEFNYEDL